MVLIAKLWTPFVKIKLTEVFTQLGKDDIKELGITALGDRKKLQQLITRLKNIEESMGNEYLTLEESNVSSPARFSTSTHSSSGCSKIGGNLDMVRIVYKMVFKSFVIHRIQFHL